MDSNMPRLDPFLKGLKAGAVKKTVDKIANKITDPVADLIAVKLQEQFPHLGFAAPTIKVLIQATFIMGIAELFGLALPMLNADQNREKVAQLEVFLRSYAGEKTGEELVDIVTRMIPIVLESFSEINPEELKLIASSTDEVEFSVPNLISEEILA